MTFEINDTEKDIAPELVVLEQMAAQSNQVFFIYNLTTKHLDFVNPIFKEVWETRKRKIEEKWLLNSVHPDDRDFVLKSFTDFLKSQRSLRMEFRITLPHSGRVKWISLLAYFVIEDGKKKNIIGFADDITARKEREDNSARFNARKNAVLDILSHDLKGSMAMIQMMNRQISEQVKKMNNLDLLEYSRIIGQLCQNNMNLVQSLLESELIESAELEISCKRLDLASIINQIFLEYNHPANQHQRLFNFECEPESVYVEVDENLYGQVFSNLISNAVKFTPEGGEITVCLKEHEDQVQACVRDNGIGIPTGLHNVLFDRFTKARRPGLRGEETTGLGLSIVKKIVELHGGKIWVESEENQGTTFYLTIPKITTLKAVQSAD